MSTRQDMAAQFGLPPEACWDEVYAAWKWHWSLRRNLLGMILRAAALPVLIVIVSQHWIAIAAAILLFAATMVILVIGFYFAMEDQYFGLLGRADQILQRAKRDGIYL